MYKKFARNKTWEYIYKKKILLATKISKSRKNNSKTTEKLVQMLNFYHKDLWYKVLNKSKKYKIRLDAKKNKCVQK